MAIKTKYTFPNASGANGQSTTVFANHGIELNNQDDLDVYVYLSTTGRVLQYRQSTGSTTDSNHPQVNDTTGLYFPSVSTGVTLYNYTLSTDFNTITFSSAVPTGGIVSVERRTRDSSGNYTNFTSGGSIRSTELNSAFDESNFTAQEARNKAFDLENRLLYSNFTPYKDNTIDLGSSTKEWKDLWIDGTAHLDSVDIDAGAIDGTTIGGSSPAAGTFTNGTIATADINGGAIDGTTIGASSASTGAFTTLTTSSNATVNGNIVVTGTISDSGGNLELNDDVNISGHLRFPDDKKIYLGNGDDASIDWDTDGWIDRLQIESAGDIQFKAASGKKYSVYVDSAIPLQIFETYISPRVDIKPYPSNAVDLGKSDGQWKDLYVDGTGYIDTVNADDITGSAIVTSGASTSDTKIYSAKRAGEIFYEKSTVDDITSGDTWVGDDNKLATTAAIDARIIDLVDDVGGFVPIANETSFPNANPDVNNGAGTIVSIGSLASNLTSNGSGVISISNGTVGNSTVTINGAANSTTYSAGYGMLVETTSTLNTYTFHRYVPKATEVTTVAGNIANVNTVAGNNSNITTVAGISGNVTTVAGIASNVTTVAGVAANVTTVAGISSNVTTVAGDTTAINNITTNLSAVQGAATNATNAASSATAAASSATSAATSATTATTQATTATTQASTATTQATNAASSATSAASSATTATTQASTATTQASNASTSAANALAYRNTTLTYRNDANGILTQVESAPYNLADNVSSHTAWGNITDTGANAVFSNETSNILLTMSEGSSSYNYGSIT